jgi:tight adherence protein B
MEIVALFFLVTVAIGGIAWVFLYPILSGTRKAEQRQRIVMETTPVVRTAAARAAAARTQQKSRREQIEGSLKEFDARKARASSVSLTQRISQAGLNWSKNKFYIISGAFGLGGFLIFSYIDPGLPYTLATAFAAGFGLPRWILRFLKNRREKKFIAGFPDAVDVVVRGIKAGLPLADSLRVISNDAPEPIKTEFRLILETQAIGMPLGEACSKLYERIPLQEANFFGIVIAIQQKAGGNLSEALGNLSKVLRERKKMRGKIQAMSMEAKSSAAIIGCLPIAVMGLVYLSSPQYIELLWTHPTGRFLMACSAGWMTVGVLVMRKMINFDF